MGIGDLNRFDSEVETLNYGNESSTDELAEEKECVECETLFTITQGEANYFIQHELIAPKRCKPCRASRKANSPTRTPETYRPPTVTAERERVSITCDHCGRDAEVPFKPFPDSSVYCRVCWVGIKNIGAHSFNYNLPKQPRD